MGLFNILKKKEVINYNLSEDQKRQVEKICDEYLKNIAKEYDKKLHIDDGIVNKPSFNSEENFYDWNKDGFVINFFSIDQDDYFENGKIFEKIGIELKEKIKSIIDVDDAKFADDCPIIFFKVLINVNGDGVF